MKIPEETLNPLIELIDNAIPQGQTRPHLGVSLLGGPCDRKIWLSFRWAVIERFPGRILRLFARGNAEESVMANYLRKAGLDLRFTGWDQRRVNFGHHVSGSMDGIILSGVPEAPKKPHVWECKTHSKKSFDDLEKNGVEKSKPEHWAQMQGYMYGTFAPGFEPFGVDRALYTAVCKDDDRIYTERVRFDKEKAMAIIARGKRIATDDRLPPPLSTDPTWYECKFCPAHEFCHLSKTTAEVNCRTCAHSTAEVDGTWSCTIHGPEIPVDFQREGCRSHVVHPDLAPWKELEGDGRTGRYVIDGEEVLNGEAGKDSRELIGPGALFGKVFGGEVEVVDFDKVRGSANA